ncbi:MAG: hypothetical protein IPN85_16350 [Flavobacteriales bacterium]|jgi:hypothetical protein|nr:hypothetical protein [Flavobacteriales bacterium]MBK9286900.1 hypothetical protein [Flavobacteriales bacterium]MBL0035002.1 hypothetical protein [Flavobacteriales bacterium]
MKLRYRAQVWLFIAAVLLSGNLMAQSTGMDQVQAVVVGLHSAQQAHHVDVMLRDVEGVRMSRTDVTTRNMLIWVEANSTLNKTGLQDLLTPYGLTLRCWSRVPRSNAPFKHLDPDHCGDTPSQK